jgi:hypothetical protein
MVGGVDPARAHLFVAGFWPSRPQLVDLASVVTERNVDLVLINVLQSSLSMNFVID